MPYPLTKFHFLVNWGGTNISFQEVSGLDMERDVVEYRSGADTSFAKQQIPGLKKMTDVVFKRGMFESDNEFYEWMNATRMNTPDRRNITITLLNDESEPIVVWTIINAWPSKIQSTDLKAESTEIAIESVTVKHEGLTTEFI